ncbi:MAG: hypothetical protein WC494_00735 [Candidatus Pacearchaeota archaeon]
MAERKIVYCWEVESQVPQVLLYHLLIQNEPREINQIKDKLFAQLEPLEETQTIARGLIRESGGLHYELLSVSSALPNELLEFSKIYKGSVKVDRRLRSRVSEENWGGLIEKIESGEF